jgi:hypothetical protein
VREGYPLWVVDGISENTGTPGLAQPRVGIETTLGEGETVSDFRQDGEMLGFFET